MKPIRLAIVGATGLVGRTTLDVLQEWHVPLASLRLLASDGSAGREITFGSVGYVIERLTNVPQDVDAAIFATSGEISRVWVPPFREAGIFVIDHSSYFRMNSDVPLVIPEINASELSRHSGLVSNPNCTASVVLLPLAALESVFGLRTVIVDTYQSVSGSGQSALDELDAQLRDSSVASRVYPRRIAHNLFPQVGSFDDDGCCDEERKVVDEIRKILKRPDLLAMTTTVRVPVRVGHSAAVTVECQRLGTRCEIEAAFQVMPGMIYEAETYRTPIEIAGRQEVFVGRLRIHPEHCQWLQFWVVGDNLRKGAASNAVQILMDVFRE